MTAGQPKNRYLEGLILILDLSTSAFVYLVTLDVYLIFGEPGHIDFGDHTSFLLVVLTAFFFSRQFTGLGSRQVVSRSADIRKVVSTMLLTMMLSFAMIFLLHLDFVSRRVLVSFALFNCVALIMLRLFFRWWHQKTPRSVNEGILSVLIIGSGVRARDLGDRLLRATDTGVHIIGFLDPKGTSAGRRADDHILGHVNEISAVLKRYVVDEVIVAVPRSLLGDVQEIIDACQEEAVCLRFMADIYDFKAARIQLDIVDGIPLLGFEPVARNEQKLLIKRLIDVIVVLSSIPFVLPIMLLVAIAIRLDSPGPAIFRQNRVGLRKRRFWLYKFRSMVVDAEDRIADLEHLNEADGPNFKIKNDPRITRVGSFIRQSSLDELPQLFNVLVGDMSLVGPRPMAERDVEQFDRGIQRKRFSVKPGITCIWQVSGRSDLAFEDWLKLDLEYIENWSLWLDVKILFKTVPAVLKGSGAA